MASIAEYLVRDMEFFDASFDISTHTTRLTFSIYSYAMEKYIFAYESELEYLEKCDGNGQSLQKKCSPKRPQGVNIVTRKRKMGKTSRKDNKKIKG